MAGRHERLAEEYADALGLHLGELLRLTGGSQPPQPVRYGARAMSRVESAQPDIAELSLEPQPVSVVAHCTTVWQLAD